MKLEKIVTGLLGFNDDCDLVLHDKSTGKIITKFKIKDLDVGKKEYVSLEFESEKLETKTKS